MTLGHRLSLALGVAQTLAWATTFYMPTVIAGPAAAWMGDSPTALLGGFSWALLIAGLSSPLVGRRIERAGGRGVLACSSVVMAAGLVLMAAVPTLAGWWIAWTVLGGGMALGLYDASFATIGRLLGVEARPAIVGVTLLAGFASTVGWPMGVALVGLVGWRATLLVYAAIQLAVNLPLVLLLVPPAGRAAPIAAGGGAAPQPVPPQAGLAAFILLAAFFSIRAGISAVVSVHALRLLGGVGLTAGAAVGVAALFGPSQVFGRMLEWGFARWLNPFTASACGAVLLPLGVIALLIGAPPVAFAVGYGMSNGILTISRGTLPMHLFGPRGYATRLGRLALPPLLAQAAAPTAITPLVLAWPASRVFAALGIAAAVALLCLLLLWLPASRRRVVPATPNPSPYPLPQGEGGRPTDPPSPCGRIEP